MNSHLPSKTSSNNNFPKRSRSKDSTRERRSSSSIDSERTIEDFGIAKSPKRLSTGYTPGRSKSVNKARDIGDNTPNDSRDDYEAFDGINNNQLATPTVLQNDDDDTRTMPAERRIQFDSRSLLKNDNMGAYNYNNTPNDSRDDAETFEGINNNQLATPTVLQNDDDDMRAMPAESKNDNDGTIDSMGYGRTSENGGKKVIYSPKSNEKTHLGASSKTPNLRPSLAYHKNDSPTPAYGRPRSIKEECGLVVRPEYLIDSLYINKPRKKGVGNPKDLIPFGKVLYKLIKIPDEFIKEILGLETKYAKRKHAKRKKEIEDEFDRKTKPNLLKCLKETISSNESAKDELQKVFDKQKNLVDQLKKSDGTKYKGSNIVYGTKIQNLVEQILKGKNGQKLLHTNYQVHHKIPRDFGGTNDYNNLILIHAYYHARLTAYQNDLIAAIRNDINEKPNNDNIEYWIYWPILRENPGIKVDAKDDLSFENLDHFKNIIFDPDDTPGIDESNAATVDSKLGKSINKLDTDREEMIGSKQTLVKNSHRRNRTIGESSPSSASRSSSKGSSDSCGLSAKRTPPIDEKSNLPR